MVRPPNGGDFNVLAFINAKEKEQCTFSGQPHVEMGWQGDTAHTAQGFFSIYWRNSTTASLYLCFFTLSWFLFRKAYTEVYTFNINSLFLMPGLLYTGKIPQFVLTVLFSLNIHTHSLCSEHVLPPASSWSDLDLQQPEARQPHAGQLNQDLQLLFGMDTEATCKTIWFCWTVGF